MMSIFDAKDNQTFIDRILSLSPDSPRQWGKMDVAQMMAHCVEPMRIAFREVKSQRTWIGFFFGGMAKRRYIEQNQSFQHNLPTAPSFLQTESKDFDEQKARLISYVKRWVTEGPSSITTDAHPFFGKMTTADWDKLICSHLDHHLRQFGA